MELILQQQLPHQQKAVDATFRRITVILTKILQRKLM